MTKRQLAFSTLFTALALAGCVDAAAPTADTVALSAAATTALRTKADFARGIRWELHWGRVEAFDLATERPLRTIVLPGAILADPVDACTPDIVIDRSGALVVSSNITTRMWRISPARFETEVFDLELASDADKDFGFSALALGMTDRELYALSSITGAVWRVELESGKATKMPGTYPVRGMCAAIGRGADAR